MSDNQTITLSRAGFELVVSPRFGLVLSFRRDGMDILHPAPDGPPNPLTSAAYPLIPFSGRIANASFKFGGQRIELPKNFPPEPHAIHGFSWEADWSVSQQAESVICLRHVYSGDTWPWQYEAEQRFELLPDGLSLQINLTNLSDRPMPGGLGWHPFFPSSGASIQADVFGYWPSEKGGTPKSCAPLPSEFDIRTLKLVEGLDLDHCFQAGPEPALIFYESHSVEISYSPVFTQLIVYNPADQDFFCTEPVSHSPDAANSDLPRTETGWKTLGAGETLSGDIRLSIS